MTSIEWLISVLAHNDILDHKKVSSNKQLYKLYLRLKDQAKEMHKKEHGDTWDAALLQGSKRGDNIMRAWEDFDEYYQETFKQPKKDKL
jgi:hypothetical protein